MADYNPTIHSIFECHHHPSRNACVGENGGSGLEDYALGYFEATKVLLVQVLAPQSRLTEDILIYPILFSLRHGVELSLKLVISILEGAGLGIRNRNRATHDLDLLVTDFKQQAQYDSRLLKLLHELRPTVTEIHQADPSAQEFRFAETTDGIPSLVGKSIVDLYTLAQLVDYSERRFRELFWLARRIKDERNYNSFTKEFNRDELEELSIELPPRGSWADSTEFLEVKEKWMSQYELSSNGFQRAIGFIESHLEFAGNIGIYTPLKSITEEELIQLMTAAKDLHDHYRNSDPFDTKSLLSEPDKRYFKTTNIALSEEFVVEMNSLFYLGRDYTLSEAYPDVLSHCRYSSQKPIESDLLWLHFSRIFGKMNFIESVCKGLRMTGRPHLASKCEKFRSR